MSGRGGHRGGRGHPIQGVPLRTTMAEAGKLYEFTVLI